MAPSVPEALKKKRAAFQASLAKKALAQQNAKRAGVLKRRAIIKVNLLVNFSRNLNLVLIETVSKINSFSGLVYKPGKVGPYYLTLVHCS